MRRALLVFAAMVAVIGFAVAALVITHPAAAPSAPTGPHSRIVVIAASDDFAIYEQATRAASLNAGDFYGGALYAVGPDGVPRALPTFTDGARGVDLVGSTLVQETNHASENSSHYTVHFLDLATGQRGDVALPPGDAELAAAPGGFVHAYRPRSSPARIDVVDLELQTYSGSTVPLGTPYPDGRVFGVVAGDFGLVAVTAASDEDPNIDATVRYMSWTAPGVWRTILDAHRVTYLGCARPSRTSVACSVVGPGDAAATRFGVVNLDTAKAVWIPKSQNYSCTRLDLATDGGSLVGIETGTFGSCLAGRLIRLVADGSFAASSARYSGPGSIRVGLGGILVSNAQQTQIELLAGVTQNPRIVARAS